MKYDKILDALQSLLVTKELSTISVSEIAQTAGIGKGSIYYYFPSKEAILEALVKRSYEAPLDTAKHLAEQTDISPFTRMAMIFQACRNFSPMRRERFSTMTILAAIWLGLRKKSPICGNWVLPAYI